MAAGMPALQSMSMVAGGTVALGDASATFAGTLGLQLTGTWTGTITFQASIDGVTWVSIYGMPIGSSTPALGPTSGVNDIWVIDATNMQQVRLNCTAGGTGTVVIYRSMRVG